MAELIKIVADAFKKAGLTINKAKSEFCQRRIKYLGFIISEKGWEIDPEKIDAILNYARPRTVRDARRFLGMLNFFRRFIPNLSELTAAISALTAEPKKNKVKKRFVWTDEADIAFNKIKTILTSPPILAFPDFSQPFNLHIDASNTAVSGILTQGEEESENVISYFSKKLNSQQARYSAVERELLGLLLSVEKFKGYIEGTKFNVITDCAAITYLKTMKTDGNNRIARWIMNLQNYDMEFHHKKGTLNVLPDALSRAVETLVTTGDNGGDPEYLSLLNEILNCPDDFNNFKICNGKIYKLVLPRETCLADKSRFWKEYLPKSEIPRILLENHDDFGHQGIFKTYQRIKQKFYFPKMYDIVKNYVKSCDICRMSKSDNFRNQPPMGAPKEASYPFEMICVDFLGPFPRSKDGKTSCLVIVDWFSKFSVIHTMPSQDGYKMCKFLEWYFSIFGYSRKIVNDNGPQFTSKNFQRLIEKYEMESLPNAFYHPSNNPAERVNRVIGDTLRAYVGEDHRTWDQYVNLIQSAINSSVHESTGFTPHFVVFGREMSANLQDFQQRSVNDQLNQDFILPEVDVEKVFQRVKENMDKAYERYSHHYNLRSRRQDYNVGDWVFMKTHPKSSKSNHFSKKLHHKKVKVQISGMAGSNVYHVQDIDGKYLGRYSGKDLYK
jgi:hypothetical protein